MREILRFYVGKKDQSMAIIMDEVWMYFFFEVQFESMNQTLWWSWTKEIKFN